MNINIKIDIKKKRQKLISKSFFDQLLDDLLKKFLNLKA